ncbi:MAG: ExeM/NucH family extracellular endonuclease, partial [Actinomycetota bacterium]|nr:ExeM/NucH family extracellular endonuclease [Actinomycetota bacterium]
ADAVVSFTTIDLAVCGEPATAIHDIQGSGGTSPIVGASVSVEAVVVADLQGPGQFSGYFLQEEDADADADPLTSEGLFVFDSANPVAVGDVVRLTGNVVEFVSSGQPLTELSGVTGLQLCATGQSVTPTAISLPVADLTVWERTEGMRVSLPQELSVTETFTLGRFGEVSLSVGGRLFIPTAVTTPGAAAIALQNLNDRSRILLDDANNQQNVDPIRYPEPTGLTAFETLREGDTIIGLTGVLDQRFGAYRVQPTGPVAFTEANPRPTAAPVVGGGIQVASMNVLNFFNGDGLGGGFPTSRGANTPAELVRQRDKIVAALIGMDADIVGLNEIENDSGPNSALAELVGALNAVAGPGTYAYIDTGVVGGDAIRVSLIYQPASVSPVGTHAVLDSTIDPRFDDTRSRPAIAQTFSQNNNGQRFTVVVNHLKSKGSACAGDPDIGDGQGNCNVTRTQAALALADWLATDPTGSGDPDVLIIGDLNSYGQEDPITALKNGGYTDLVADRVGPGAYSYVFGGQSGYLDHALANASLEPQVTGVGEWHINADEPLALDYNVEFKSVGQQALLYAPTPYRSSDHDPVLVGICQSPTLSVELDQTVIWIPNHKYRTITATPTASGDVVSIDLVSAVSNEPDNANGIGDGNTVNDVVIVDDTTVKVRAERSALGQGRTYTMTWVATNDCGATTTATATVFVPNQWSWIF